MDDIEDSQKDGEEKGLSDDIDLDDLGDELGIGESDLADDDGVIFDSGEDEEDS